MLGSKKWPLLYTLLLNTGFLEVPVNCLLRSVRSIGNKKLLSNYLRIYDNRTSYKPVVPRSKDGGYTIPRGCNARD
jgi:hypothetical protein